MVTINEKLGLLIGSIKSIQSFTFRAHVRFSRYAFISLHWRKNHRVNWNVHTNGDKTARK